MTTQITEISDEALQLQNMHAQVIYSTYAEKVLKTNPKDFTAEILAKQGKKKGFLVLEELANLTSKTLESEDFKKASHKRDGEEIVQPTFSQEELDRTDTLLSDMGLGTDVAKKIKECIPCGLRKIEFKNPFEGSVGLDSLDSIFNSLLTDLNLNAVNCKDLLMGTGITDDFCSLIDAFNDLCIPDLVAILSILGMLQAKLTFSLELDLGKLVTSLISALLGGLLLDLKVTLDQYSKMILDPIQCILSSIEKQMAKLDLSAGFNKAAKAQQKYNKQKIELLESNLKELKNAKEEIRTKDPSDTKQLTKIEREIKRTEDQLSSLRTPIGSSAYFGSKANEVSDKVQDGRKAVHAANQQLNDFRNGLTTSLEFLNDKVREGEQYVKELITTYTEELTRTLQLDLTKNNDLISLAAQLEEIMRLIGLVNVLIELISDRDKLKQQMGCSTDDVISRYAKSSDLNFYKTKIIDTDDNGNTIVTNAYVVTPPSTTLISSTITTNDQGELMEEVERYNQNDEVRQANNNGVIPQIGDLNATALELSYNNGIEGNVDSKYIRVLPQNFCKDNDINLADKLQQWTKTL